MAYIRSMPYDYKKLKAGREKAGLNKERLAGIMGCTGALIGLIEKGERQNPETIKLFASKVKVKMEDIVISDEEFAEMRARDAAAAEEPEPRKRA